MIVFADADLDRVSQAAVYGAFAHDGRHCVSIERLYVERGILADFVSAVVAGASGLRRSPGPDADLTPESGPGAFLRLQERIEDALGRGAQRFFSDRLRLHQQCPDQCRPSGTPLRRGQKKRLRALPRAGGAPDLYPNQIDHGTAVEKPPGTELVPLWKRDRGDRRGTGPAPVRGRGETSGSSLGLAETGPEQCRISQEIGPDHLLEEEAACRK